MTYEINCAYSITDFDVLMGILPDTLETLVVEPKLIKKSFLLKNNEHLLKTLTFMETYPDLTILDTNGNNLLNVLQEIDKDFENKKLESDAKKIEQATQVIKETFEIKVIGKHLDIKEILEYCHRLPEYDSYSDDVLERLIRNVLSDQRQNGIKKKTMRRPDGVNVVCIEASQLESVLADLRKLIQERETEKIKEATISIEKQEIVKQQTVVLQPIKIKKYIKPGQLKEIKKSSGEQNANAALRIINEINLDPLEMQFQGPVHIIKNGRETVSATVKKESGCCLVQSIDSSNHDDTKRIVWGVADGPDGLILVCIGFREHHNTKKASNMYEDLRSMAYKKQTYTEQDLSEYLEIGSVDDDGNPGDSNNGSDDDLLLQKTDILSHKLADFLAHKY